MVTLLAKEVFSFKEETHMHAHCSSGDGSSASLLSEDARSPLAMALAVKVHEESSKVMYFA